MPKDIALLLKDYSIRQSVIRNHYPIKYWCSNKNLFIHLTFWIWFCWMLMALGAIFIPINNQQKLGRGAIVVFETTFNYIAKILSKNSSDSSANLSNAIWNYEAYIFVFLTSSLVLLSFYCIHVVKIFFLDLRKILDAAEEKVLSLKLVILYKYLRYFSIACVALSAWTAFCLLYVSRPQITNIGTILFKPNQSNQQYYKDLTFTGWITSLLNVVSLCFVVPLYAKYSRELFLGNSFFFKNFRVKDKTLKKLTPSNIELDQNIAASLNVRSGQDYSSPNTAGYIVELRGVNKYFSVGDGYFHALKNINLNIKDGDFVVILGYSGSGKTTLLNILSGIDRPTTGNSIIYGCNTLLMADSDLNLFRRKNIGYIFQNYALLPNLTASENIAITQNMDTTPFKVKWRSFLESYKKTENMFQKIWSIVDFFKSLFISTSNKKELEYLIDALNLTEHKDKYPHQLSGGQQQRVAITRALIKKPKILLADEPTGAIDHSMTKSILELFYNINEYAKTTVILITHNPLIARMAKRILHVSNGMIVEDVINENPQKPSEIQGL